MYELSPSAAWKDFARSALPKVKRDNFGEPMLEAWPEPGKDPRELLDFGILPDIVSYRYTFENSTNLCGSRLERGSPLS